MGILGVPHRSIVRILPTVVILAANYEYNRPCIPTPACVVDLLTTAQYP